MGSSSAAASVRFVAEGQHARRGLIWRFDRSLTGTLRASTHKTTRRRRSAFPITETELKVMAALGHERLHAEVLVFENLNRSVC